MEDEEIIVGEKALFEVNYNFCNPCLLSNHSRKYFPHLISFVVHGEKDNIHLSITSILNYIVSKTTHYKDKSKEG